MRLFKTTKRSSKWEAVGLLCLLIETLKRDGFAIDRAYLVPESVPTGHETYQYAVVCH